MRSITKEIVNAVGNKSAYATWLAKKVADKTIKGEDIYKYKNYLPSIQFTILEQSGLLKENT